MKRSTINSLIDEAIQLFETTGFKLPPFAHWSQRKWQSTGSEAGEIRDNHLGWDVTDFGSGQFNKTGLLLFTIRNGNYNNPEQYPKRYAEKIMVVREQQVTPYHFHWKKREDIINRGGGCLVLELYKSAGDTAFSQESFSVSVDGVQRQCQPGAKIVLQPGESICLEPCLFHTFYGEKDKGSVVVGEVSDVNDDSNDNCFLEAVRFPHIEEDEPPRYLLCTEYPEA